MNHPDDIGAFLERLPPMSDAEGVEIVLSYVNAALRGMSTETLRLFRACCLEMHGGTTDQTIVLEVIDGLMALWEIDLRS